MAGQPSSPPGLPGTQRRHRDRDRQRQRHVDVLLVAPTRTPRLVVGGVAARVLAVRRRPGRRARAPDPSRRPAGTAGCAAGAAGARSRGRRGAGPVGRARTRPDVPAGRLAGGAGALGGQRAEVVRSAGGDLGAAGTGRQRDRAAVHAVEQVQRVVRVRTGPAAGSVARSADSAGGLLGGPARQVGRRPVGVGTGQHLARARAGGGVEVLERRVVGGRVGRARRGPSARSRRGGWRRGRGRADRATPRRPRRSRPRPRRRA